MKMVAGALLTALGIFIFLVGACLVVGAAAQQYNNSQPTTDWTHYLIQSETPLKVYENGADITRDGQYTFEFWSPNKVRESTPPAFFPARALTQKEIDHIYNGGYGVDYDAVLGVSA